MRQTSEAASTSAFDGSLLNRYRAVKNKSRNFPDSLSEKKAVYWTLPQPVYKVKQLYLREPLKTVPLRAGFLYP